MVAVPRGLSRLHMTEGAYGTRGLTLVFVLDTEVDFECANSDIHALTMFLVSNYCCTLSEAWNAFLQHSASARKLERGVQRFDNCQLFFGTAVTLLEVK